MRVLSLIRRDQGHEVVMEGVTYTFHRPDWACEVSDPRHAARFAAIPEGYRLEPEPLAMEAAARPAGQSLAVGQSGQRPAVSDDRQEVGTGLTHTPRRRGRPPRKPEASVEASGG